MGFHGASAVFSFRKAIVVDEFNYFGRERLWALIWKCRSSPVGFIKSMQGHVFDEYD